MAEKVVWLLLENIEFKSRSYCREVVEVADQTRNYVGRKIYNLIAKTESEQDASDFVTKRGRWAE